MLTHHYMLADLAGSLLATVGFAAILFAPGYVVAFATDLFHFRRLALRERAIWAVATSFLISPLLGYFLGRATNLRVLAYTFAALAAAALVLLLVRTQAAPKSSKRTLLVLLGWTAFVLLMLVDFETSHKLWFSVVMADQSYRVAFTDAVVRTGVPPANPLYFSGAPAAMPYYYFWYVLCAAVVELTHVTARQAFIASSIWAGFGLLATTHLFTTHFFRFNAKRRWTAIALLAVTGADILPSVGNAILQPHLNGDIEWWSVEPIDAWPDSLLWVPHHVASLLCCLLSFLFLLQAAKLAKPAARYILLALAAIGFASSVGLSVYVSFGYVLMLCAWVGWLLVRRDPHRFALLRDATLLGAFSGVLLIPFLHELLSGFAHAVAAPTAPAGHLFSLSVRNLIDSGLLTGLPAFARFNATHPVLLDQLLRLALLLPGLALELGLYGAVLFLLIRHRRRAIPPYASISPASPYSAALILTIFGFVLSIFLGSSVITNNDFGYRAVMLPQFFLLLLTADVLGGWWSNDPDPVVPKTRWNARVLYTLLGLGVAGTVYGAILLRAWLPFEAHHEPAWWAQSAGDAFEIRSAFADLHRSAAPNAVLAFRPIDPTPDRAGAVMVPAEYYQRTLVMESGLQMLNAERDCAVHFGGSPARCPAVQTALAQIYAQPFPSGDTARGLCRSFGITYFILSHRDPGWPGSFGWPTTLPTAVAEPGIRIFACN